MVSSTCFSISFFFFFFMLHVLLVPIVAGLDESLVDKACRRTPHPDICISCIKSDSSRVTNKIPELTYDILFCMMSEATDGHVVADLTGQKTGEPNLKQALQTCDVSLFSASNSLTDSFTIILDGKDYRKAEDALESAHRDVISCQDAFLGQPFPPELSSHVDLVTRYYDVAHVFFSLFPKQ